ncbi:Acyl-coenzyme A thioesterase 13 [Holothuria leucospilota]|uniref:Acyl-coenzyme A thioesterase 13 n=1 Tax=Holothuria leucospilota TaxID=206669 RepID=A0A9Q1BWA8_HOLLE|nr:Acyl-coenzyme A thioesterase 13 [Holothuria leucospilota]
MSESNDLLKGRVEELLKISLEIGIAPFVEPVKVASAEAGKVNFKFKVTQKLLNIQGFMHGGVLSLLVDTLTGITAFTLLSYSGVTLNLNANFVRAIKHEETIYATAVAVRAGKKIIFAEVHFRDADGNLRAYGGQTIYVVKEREKWSPVNSTTQLNKQSNL